MNTAVHANIFIAKNQADRPFENNRDRGTAVEKSFLAVAKKVFSVFAAAPTHDAGRTAPLHFKKIKETSKVDKKRTEEDALKDIEKLLRRVEKNKKAGRQS